jgi:hypothetical protein
VYWTEEKELVICGCFKGTINEFKERVIRTHKDSDYAKDYFSFIQKVQSYRAAI